MVNLIEQDILLKSSPFEFISGKELKGGQLPMEIFKL